MAAAAQAQAWISPQTQEGLRVIASVRGEVVTRLAGEVVIEAAGVGYRMAVSSGTLAAT